MQHEQSFARPGTSSLPSRPRPRDPAMLRPQTTVGGSRSQPAVDMLAAGPARYAAVNQTRITRPAERPSTAPAPPTAHARSGPMTPARMRAVLEDRRERAARAAGTAGEAAAADDDPARRPHKLMADMLMLSSAHPRFLGALGEIAESAEEGLPPVPTMTQLLCLHASPPPRLFYDPTKADARGSPTPDSPG